MDQQLTVTTPTLKAVFSKTSGVDRWSHQIFLTGGDEETVLLSSIEGDDQQTWPPSPPLQDISHHDLPTGEAILGVGMAGKGHWSASVSIEESTTLFFDMACLIKTPDPTVGSHYRLGQGVAAEQSGDDILLTAGDQEFILRPHRGKLQATLIGITEDLAIKIQPDVSSESLTGSVRWCFHLLSAS